MKTKSRGIHATFTTECIHCRGDLTITNGRIESHECWEPDDGIARLKAAFDATYNDR